MLGRREAVRQRGIGAALGAAVMAALTAASPLSASAQAPTSAPATTTTTVAATSTSSPSITVGTPTTTTTVLADEPTPTSAVPEVTTPVPPPAALTTPSASPPEPQVAPTGPPPASLSEASVNAFLSTMERTPANSTAALVDALRPLQTFGMSAVDAFMLGMGRFPLGGEAFFRDDFGEPRSGPPPHGHAGTDIFAAFDVPVRSPADGVIRFEDGGLGGKGAFVTEPDGTYYYLAHLNGFAPGLANGASVRAGQLIGYNGDTGNAKGGPPHVHFEVHPRGGAAVNPKPILDRWVADALANVPALVAPYLGGAPGGSRSLTAVGLVRHFDGGLLTGATREPEPARSDEVAAQAAADAIVSPLTPAVLRENQVRRSG